MREATWTTALKTSSAASDDDDDHPTGLVTFLMTDIEGSTALWDRDPVAMAETLERHDHIIEQVVSRGGIVLKPKGEGDATCPSFKTRRTR